MMSRVAGEVAAASRHAENRLAIEDREFQGYVFGLVLAGGRDPFFPDDPYFFTGNPPGFPGQWHLDKQNSGALVDINVRGAWERGLTGRGVVIAVIDDGVEYTHPDLQANYRPDLSWDFIGNTSDPFPQDPMENHGTAVAGLAVARGGNGQGVTGVAPYAQFASQRSGDTSSVYMNHHSVVAAIQQLSPEINIVNMSFGEDGAFAGYFRDRDFAAAALMTEQVIREATAEGTIFVSAATNFRKQHGVRWGRDGDSNRKTVARMPEVITVAALNAEGTFAEYSNWGSNVTVTVPSGDSSIQMRLITTDRTGDAGYNPSRDSFPDLDYTADFGGTSGSAPIMSGILALGKEANPALDTRMAKHLLAKTSVVVDPHDSTPMGGWTTNAAGYHFNNNYGFGLVDADAFTHAATQYVGVTPLETNTTGRLNAGYVPIPIEDPFGISRTASVDWNGPLEEVLLRVTINDGSSYDQTAGPYFSMIQIELTSPYATESMLAYPNTYTPGISLGGSKMDWTFTSNAFWGEDPFGDWIVTLSHPDPHSRSGFDWVYHWSTFELMTRSGSLIPVPEPSAWALLATGALCAALWMRSPKRGRRR